jgi:hypothetical protein
MRTNLMPWVALAILGALSACGGSSADPTMTEPDTTVDAGNDADREDCATGLTECGAECVADDDPEFGCGSVTCQPCELPSAQAMCSSGQCVVAQCNEGLADCDGDPATGCETDLATEDNCGACGVSCGAGQSCREGACALDCPEGLTPCGDDCVELDTDDAHCGGCSIACDGSQACLGGECQLQCDAPMEACGDLCVNTELDANHCGGCGEICHVPNATPLCRQAECGVQRCDDGFRDCNEADDDGCEVSIANDMANCGGCGQVCAPTTTQTQCVDGGCEYGGECLEGWVDLDGDRENGCEYACVAAPGEDLQDDDGIDSDCDGVDGEREELVFLAPSGNDRNAGTPTAPLATIDEALRVANGRTIYAAAGVYGDIRPIEQTAYLRGGFLVEGAVWRLGEERSVIQSENRIGAVISGGVEQEVRIDNFEFRATAAENTNGFGEHSLGIYVDGLRDLVLVNCLLRPSSGGAGAAGMGGDAGAAGGAGGDGVSGRVDGRGGSPGASLCGKPGGRGGRGGAEITEAGMIGEDAPFRTPETPLNAGIGGAGGFADRGTCNRPSIGPGTDGSDSPRFIHPAPDQVPGDDGAGVGMLVDGYWRGDSGGDGVVGLPGVGGGGGGGGGGGRHEIRCNQVNVGHGGGGGGGGGCGGGGGTGGKPGGASAGLFAFGASVRLIDCTIVLGPGGPGGPGGVGGDGGAGGAGGSGNVFNQQFGPGGDGGRGGRGQPGSPGGAGAAGPSVGVALHTTATVEAENLTVEFDENTPGPSAEILELGGQ